MTVPDILQYLNILKTSTSIRFDIISSYLSPGRQNAKKVWRAICGAKMTEAGSAWLQSKRSPQGIYIQSNHSIYIKYLNVTFRFGKLMLCIISVWLINVYEWYRWCCYIPSLFIRRLTHLYPSSSHRLKKLFAFNFQSQVYFHYKAHFHFLT